MSYVEKFQETWVDTVISYVRRYCLNNNSIIDANRYDNLNV